MTNEDPVGVPGIEKCLLGRRFKVNHCEADPRFAAKVARIQDEISHRGELENRACNEPQIPVKMVGDYDERQSDFEPRSSEVSISEEINVSCVESDGPCLSKKKKPKPMKIKSAHKNSVKAVSSEPTDQFENNVAMVAESQDLAPDLKMEEETGEKDPPYKNDPDIVPEVDIPCEDFRDSAYESLRTLENEGPSQDDVVGMDVNKEEDFPEQEESSVDAESPSSEILSISERIELEKYSKSEWKGGTANAEYMKLGYVKVMEETDCLAMRRIRGDNYCGLRATCFQILSQNLNILSSWKSVGDIVDVPQKLLQKYGCSWLTQWTFARRLKVTPKKKVDTMKQCLQLFGEALQDSRSIEGHEERVAHFLQFFNSGRPDEVLLFEAMKLLMLHSAVLLHADKIEDKEVPVFAWLLFARDTSETPETLMKNHLNTVGDDGGLEQVEMFLLGYALNLTIRVARPSKVTQEDFMTFYPDDHKEEWDMCNLIAEDDRHYNVIVP